MVQVGVLVLGDIGRSPRMMNHAKSLSQCGFKVQLIGYVSSPLPDTISKDDNIEIISLRQSYSLPAGSSNLLYLAYAPVKILLQTFILLTQLLWLATFRLQYLLIQIPPAIPTLPVVQLVCLLTRCQLIIDWHNFGYSIMALQLSPKHWAVRLARLIEFTFGRYAYAHLCVSQYMRDFLLNDVKVRGEVMVLYDKPASIPRKLSDDDRRLLIDSLSQSIAELNQISQQNYRLIVSSTSWTADEDFGILLDALVLYDRMSSKDPQSLPPILAVITGKGPQREYYAAKIALMKLQRIKIVQAWLPSMDDYHKLLSIADLGISLHTSSSGVDLPMKVVDMFGAGLPVCSVKYKAIHELIDYNVTGKLFSTSDQLVDCLTELFSKKSGRKLLGALRQNVEAKYQSEEQTWNYQWNRVMLPLLPSVQSESNKIKQ
ncbi:hypothetical protein MP228_009743 [Amoeboaphelidium protococcarum]|nr:hypothetical protein MP228_009743 [Amoeboaphelidium protococcarum]